MNKPRLPAFGSIVRVKDMPDSNGLNPKPTRPAVVITPNDQIQAGKPIAVVGISTFLPGPRPPDSVPLPHHPLGRIKTGLTTRCGAFPNWRLIISLDRIIKHVGRVPAPHMAQIIDEVTRLKDARGLSATKTDDLKPPESGP